MDAAPGPALPVFAQKFQQRLQYFLDKSTPHAAYRWMALAVLVLLYIVRVWYLRGFYIVTYAMGIYNLNLLLGFLTPQFDPETEGPQLPTKADQEFRPFVRRLPEFKFWLSAARSVLIGFTCTFFKFIDVPVFWPILLLYWFILFFVTMKRQIMHMIKYRYIPFTTGKKKYAVKPGERRPVKDAKSDGGDDAVVVSGPSIQPPPGVILPTGSAASTIRPVGSHHNSGSAYPTANTSSHSNGGGVAPYRTSTQQVPDLYQPLLSDASTGVNAGYQYTAPAPIAQYPVTASGYRLPPPGSQDTGRPVSVNGVAIAMQGSAGGLAGSQTTRLVPL